MYVHDINQLFVYVPTLPPTHLSIHSSIYSYASIDPLVYIYPSIDPSMNINMHKDMPTSNTRTCHTHMHTCTHVHIYAYILKLHIHACMLQCSDRARKQEAGQAVLFA